MLITVIIPTLNRADKLERLLSGLHAQSLDAGDYEVIVIDNGSTDETKEVALRYQADYTNLVYLFDERPGLHIGRHRGFMEAKADLLVFADDDIVPQPTWLAAVIGAFANEKVGLVTGEIIPDYECPPPKWMKQLWRQTDSGDLLPQFSVLNLGESTKEINPNYVWGCNFAVRRSLVEIAGGFHPDGFPYSMIKYRGDGETALANAISAFGS